MNIFENMLEVPIRKEKAMRFRQNLPPGAEVEDVIGYKHFILFIVKVNEKNKQAVIDLRFSLLISKTPKN